MRWSHVVKLMFVGEKVHKYKHKIVNVIAQ